MIRRFLAEYAVIKGQFFANSNLSQCGKLVVGKAEHNVWSLIGTWFVQIACNGHLVETFRATVFLTALPNDAEVVIKSANFGR